MPKDPSTGEPRTVHVRPRLSRFTYAKKVTDAQVLAQEAQGYLDVPIPELRRRFEDAIAGLEADGTPHRGVDREFWRGTRERLVSKVAAQGDVAVATAGVAAAEVAAWADDVGLDLAEYRIPLAIMTALVVRSVWDQLSDREP